MTATDPTPTPDGVPASATTHATTLTTAGDPAAEPARGTAATERASLLSLAGPRLAALLLGAACVAWSAAPLGPGGWPRVALVIAIVAVTAGGLRLALADVPEPDEAYLLSGPMRAWLNFLALLRTLPWEEFAVAAVLWLEVQHPARPWYTAALGLGLTAYLLITHIAESGADPARVLRRHAKLLALGACVLALGAGLAMIPAATPGAGASLLRVLAAAAVIAAAALVIPA
jgi:hypothetical protein